MEFDITKLGIPMMIAVFFSVVFGSISGYLRKQKEQKEYERMTAGARGRHAARGRPPQRRR